TMDKGDSVQIDIEWEDLYEYLPWEATPLARADAYPARIAIFRSSKTEQAYPGHFDTVNAVADWLETMGYEPGNKLDISFDNVTVPGLFSDTFSDGNADGWVRAAGCANWNVENGALRASRIGNDDNIMLTGSDWTNYSVRVDITYNEQGHYLNDAEVYLRYVDRNNFVKVGIENFFGFWRLKRTVRIDADNAETSWLFDFQKTNSPVEDVTYNLRVDATGGVFDVYFNGAYVNTFVDTTFSAGKIGVGTKATQLGFWEPRKGYYFIDDDEYSYYGGIDTTVTEASPLNLDYGYLVGFFPTLMLPGTYVMSDVEVSNVVTWIDSGLNSLIVLDGGVACENELGVSDMGRIEELLGVAASVTVVSNLTSATVGDDGHYATLDYDTGDTISISGNAFAYNSLLSSAVDVLTLDNGTVAVPGLILNQRADHPDSPSKVIVFNFDAASGGQLTNTFSMPAQRAFEWARGEAYQVTLELKYDTQSTNAFDFVILKTTGWLLTGSGTNTLMVDIPENNIMTGDNLYWVMYVHPWDSTDPWRDHGGFYTSEDEAGAPLYTSLSGVGLQVLGITDVAYAGRDWDKWIAYNTRTQELVLAYGLKDKGVIDIQDHFDDGNYTGWTVSPNANISWSVTDGALRASVSGAGGESYITRNGLALNNTNITFEYDVLFENGAASGGIIYRGVKLDLNPTRCGWVDDDPNYTNNPLTTGVWYHVVVNLRDGNPYMRSDVRVGNELVFVTEDIEVTNFNSNTIGLIAPTMTGYAAWDNIRVVDEEYAVVWSTVNGVSFPTNDVPTGTWPTVPDYDPNMIEHGGANEGCQYEWFIHFKGKDGVYARQDVNIYFSPRLMVESSNFPTRMARGETVTVPVEWEGLGTGSAGKLKLSLEDPYLGTNAARGTFDITNATGTAEFELTIDAGAAAGKNYNWLAYFYPTTATNPMLQRIGLDDTFCFQPVEMGAPIAPETTIEVTSIVDGDFVVYSDAGIPADSDLFTWSGGGGTWDSEFTIWPAAEGVETFYTLNFLSYIGWGIFDTGGVDLSAYTNGYLKFSLFALDTMKVEIEDMDGHKGTANVGPTSIYWTHYSIPMTNFPAVDFSRIKGMFMITSYDAAEYIVDQIRWSNTAD
ncbi:MAG: hypothetical protein PHG65_10315, partial [Kiritimatiellae bacterium]|nr:hypothetical protein [Kiritimatiellia bacterium]